MVGQKLSWVGLSVGDFVIKELLGEGSYSWVFKAIHSDGSSARAIKVAKPPEAVAEGGATGCVPTSAIWQMVGSILKLEPETEQLLCLQAKKLQGIDDPGIVPVDEISTGPGSCYYRMPVLSGNNLRRYMLSGPVPIEVLIDIALCLQRLANNESFRYHGDLKPENIMVTPSGVVLIDPGYFGSLEVYKGTGKQQLSNCAVTSPIYYPLLVPDDLFALGLITWEIACRQHPLAEHAVPSDFDRKNIGNSLWELVQQEEDDGRGFLTPLLGLKRPSSMRPGMPPDVEAFLLKCLRVKFEDNKLNTAKGFDSVGEYASALAQLQRKNIRYL